MLNVLRHWLFMASSIHWFKKNTKYKIWNHQWFRVIIKMKMVWKCLWSRNTMSMIIILAADDQVTMTTTFYEKTATSRSRRYDIQAIKNARYGDKIVHSDDGMPKAACLLAKLLYSWISLTQMIYIWIWWIRKNKIKMEEGEGGLWNVYAAAGGLIIEIYFNFKGQ